MDHLEKDKYVGVKMISMKKRSEKREFVYRDINNLYTALETIDLFLISGKRLKNWKEEQNEYIKNMMKRKIPEHGDILEGLIADGISRGHDEYFMLVKGSDELNEIQKSINQLEIMNILFEEKLKRVKCIIDEELDEERRVLNV